LGELNEAALLAGFVAFDQAVYAPFYSLLVSVIRSLLNSRWKSMHRVHAEIEDRCVTRTVEWRESGLLRTGETISDLASRLVKQSVEDVQRVEDNARRIKKATAALPPEPSSNPEKALFTNRMRQRVWDLQATLEPKHQRALEAYAQSEIEDVTMAEILGVSPEAAWKMAERARKAFSDAVLQAGLKASDFLEGHDG
jgi:DNA-directed RNA polymerase specialized sigma24 family protein